MLPLIHLLTSPVVQAFSAAAIAAAGGSPVLVRDPEEAAVVEPDALLLNLGMWRRDYESLYFDACRRAVERGIPVVLDPVGAAFSDIRRSAALELIRRHPGALFLKGNASELLALSSGRTRGRGIDSAHPSSAAVDAARSLESLLSGWLISGEVDIVGADGFPATRVEGGSALMGAVVGTGCVLGALLALELTVADPPPTAAVRTARAVKSAGETAAYRCGGPGSFPAHFIDALHTAGEGV